MLKTETHVKGNKIPMKKSVRLISLIVSLVLVIGIMVSCSSSSVAVMKYKDSSISANMYSYWLSTYKASFLSYYNNSLDSDAFWDSYAADNMTAEEYAFDKINENIKFILVGMQLYREYGLKIDSEIVSAINSDIAEKTEFLGGRSQMNAALSEYGINIDILKEIYISEEKLYTVYDYLYGENGIEKITNEQLDKYYEDNYSRVRYLVIYTTEKIALDSDGNPQYDSDGYVITEELTEEEKAEKKAKVDEAMLCVNAGDNFQTIMLTYNEVDMSAYPNGFYISPNELNIYGFKMVSETASMEVGEIRKIEDEYATYIVEKLPLLERSEWGDADSEQMANLENYCIQQNYEEKFTSLAAEVEINEDEISKFRLRSVPQNSYF